MLTGAALVTLTACAHTETQPEATNAANPTSKKPAPESTTPAKTAPGDTTTFGSDPAELRGPSDLGPDDPGPGDEESAAEHAKATMQAFFATGKNTKQWWSDLKPYLTPSAQELWQWTEPRRIRRAEIQDVDVPVLSATDAEVTVGTTAGDYTLVLFRTDAKKPWLTSAIETPQGEQ